MSLSYFACLPQRIKTFSSGTLINALASVVLSSSYIPFCYPVLSSLPSLISHIHIYVFLLPSPLAICSSKISSFCTYLSKLFFFLQDFSAGSKEVCMCVCVCVCVLSRISSVLLFVTLTVAHQAPLSKGFSRQQYWSGLPSLPPGDPDPRIKPAYLCLWHSQAGSLPLAPPGKPYICVYIYIYIPIYIYICMYVCVYVYMYVYIYIFRRNS